MGKIIEVETTVFVDLRDIEDDELLDELEDRKLLGTSSIKEMVKELKLMNCPKDIIDRLEQWGEQPMVTEEKLAK